LAGVYGWSWSASYSRLDAFLGLANRSRRSGNPLAGCWARVRTNPKRLAMAARQSSFQTETLASLSLCAPRFSPRRREPCVSSVAAGAPKARSAIQARQARPVAGRARTRRTARPAWSARVAGPRGAVELHVRELRRRMRARRGPPHCIAAPDESGSLSGRTVRVLPRARRSDQPALRRVRENVGARALDAVLGRRARLILKSRGAFVDGKQKTPIRGGTGVSVRPSRCDGR
jgi:hypothetical protein